VLQEAGTDAFSLFELGLGSRGRTRSLLSLFQRITATLQYQHHRAGRQCIFNEIWM